MFFGDFTVWVRDKSNGSLTKHKADNLMSANGISSLYNKLGHESWIDKNLRVSVPEEKIAREYKQITKILKKEQKNGYSYDEDDEDYEESSNIEVDFNEMYY